ncbi:glycosyltransferase family 4 protein [Paenibacillus thermotolerans]|uniref:glycosyltransferase family 4 protein n=1 Tax=Paenibacillus thermotolerans TaxID=3027807 RepID=UPI00236797D7|nr:MULTISPECIES: glycosyltransferase family 4 protein [unclassified Paenibacillus]
MMELVSKPKNLTVVWGCYQGGVETALSFRLRYMNDAGIESHCYFHYPGMGISNFIGIPHHISNVKEDFIAYVKQHRFKYITFINTLYNMELLKELDYRVKVIYELHGYGSPIEHELQKINNFEDQGMIRGVVVPSVNVEKWAKQQLSKRPDIRVFVATNTLDMEKFRYTSNVDRFVKESRLRGSWLTSPLLGWVGRIDSNKNWSLLLDIFRLLRLEIPQMRLLLAGDLTTSRDLDRFYRKAAKYKLVKYLRTLPNIPYHSMPMYYSLIAKSGGLLISTSRSEGYPYHLLEAQACECPVVCTNIPGSMELVKNGDTGFTYSLDNPKEAVEIVKKLMAVKQKRSQIQQNARSRALSCNAIDRNISVYIDWLQGLGKREEATLAHISGRGGDSCMEPERIELKFPATPDAN